MSRLKRLILIAALAVAGLALAPARSEAGYAIRYSTDGGFTFTTVNNGDADDESSSANIIAINTEIGAFEIIDATGIRTTTAGSRKLDLAAVAVQSDGGLGGTLLLQLSANDFDLGPAPNFSFRGFGGGTVTNGTLAVSSFASTSNSLFDTSGTDTVSVLGGPFADTSGDGTTWNYDQTRALSQSGFTMPFSMTVQYEFAVTGVPSDFSGNAHSVMSLPVPAGAVLALTGLPVFGVGAWVRRRKAATAA